MLRSVSSVQTRPPAQHSRAACSSSRRAGFRSRSVAQCLASSPSGTPQQLCSTAQSARPHQSARRLVACTAIRALENYNSDIQLPAEAQAELTRLMGSETFCKQVVRECRLDGKVARFSGILFQPVPWSINTPKGMARQYEQYSNVPGHQIINVPPNFMFQAKVSTPSRLCAVFDITSAAGDGQDAATANAPEPLASP